MKIQKTTTLIISLLMLIALGLSAGSDFSLNSPEEGDSFTADYYKLNDGQGIAFEGTVSPDEDGEAILQVQDNEDNIIRTKDSVDVEGGISQNYEMFANDIEPSSDEDRYNWRIRWVSDESNSAENSEWRSIIIEENDVSFTAPEPDQGETFDEGETVDIGMTVNAEDDGDKEIIVDGNTIETDSMNAGSSRIEASEVFDPSSSAYSWYVEYEDTWGNTYTSSTNDFIVEFEDPDPPEFFSWSTPEDGETYDEDQTIEWEFTGETGDETAEIIIELEGSEMFGQNIGSDTLFDYTGSDVITNDLSEGTYTTDLILSTDTHEVNYGSRTFSVEAEEENGDEPIEETSVALQNPDDGVSFQEGQTIDFEYNFETKDDSTAYNHELYVQNPEGTWIGIGGGSQSPNTAETHIFSEDVGGNNIGIDGEYDWTVAYAQEEDPHPEDHETSETRSFDVDIEEDVEPEPEIRLLSPSPSEEFRDFDIEFMFEITTYGEEAEIELHTGDGEVYEFSQEENIEEELYEQVHEYEEMGVYDWEVIVETETHTVERTRQVSIATNLEGDLNSPLDGEVFAIGSNVLWDFSVQTPDTPDAWNVGIYVEDNYEEDEWIEIYGQSIAPDEIVEIEQEIEAGEHEAVNETGDYNWVVAYNQGSSNPDPNEDFILFNNTFVVEQNPELVRDTGVGHFKSFVRSAGGLLGFDEGESELLFSLVVSVLSSIALAIVLKDSLGALVGFALSSMVLVAFGYISLWIPLSVGIIFYAMIQYLE